MDGEPSVGDVLDSRYRITGVLGQGGMGSVYRAEHVTIKRPVAIKLLHPDIAEDPDYAKRFEREAFVTGQASDHPNCVTISDFGALSEGGFYLVMELVDGELLADAMDDAERLPTVRALHIARHIIRGLGHAHKAGIVHRDVKPTNVILVEQEGDKDFAKILDFGIAKLVDATAAPDGNNQLTRVGTTVGTPTYIAPEQAVAGQVDGRSDLYSASILLYEMIVGRPPFQDDEMVKLLAKHLTGDVPPMAELEPSLRVPAYVEQLIARGLEKSKDDRYADADEYIAAIDDALKRLDREPAAEAMDVTSTAAVPPSPARALSEGVAPGAPVPAGPARALSEGVAPGAPVPAPALASAHMPSAAVAGPANASAAAMSVAMSAILPTADQTGPHPRALRPPWVRYAKFGAIGLVAVIAIAIATGGSSSKGSSSMPQVPGSLLDNSSMRKMTMTPSQLEARSDALARADALAKDHKAAGSLAILKKEFGAAETDAEVQVVYGHAHMADSNPAEGLVCYARAAALEVDKARASRQLRLNVDSLIGVKRSELTISALDILAQLGDDEAKKTIAGATADKRNDVRKHARQLAEKKSIDFDRYTSYIRDLRHERSCKERAKALPLLRDLGDKRAISELKKARGRESGGILGLGASSVNGCMRDDISKTIATLEAK